MKPPKMPTNLKPAVRKMTKLDVTVKHSGNSHTTMIPDVNRVVLRFGKLELCVSADEEGNLKVHDASSNRLALLPCAANAFVIKGSRI